MTRSLYPHPSGWRVATLEANPFGDVITSAKSGSTPPTGEMQYWGGTFPWLTPKEVAQASKNRCVGASERTLTSLGVTSAGGLCKADTVLLTKRAPVGIPVINQVPMAINQGFLSFECGQALDPEFLYYWLLGNGPYLDAVANGSTYPELYTGDLFELEIAFPSRNDQQQIVSVLRALDEKIELNRRMNATLETIIQSVFRSWFADVAGNGLPEGWRQSTIRDLVCNIQYGLTESASRKPIGPRFLRITDIQGGRVDWGGVPFCKVSQEEHERYRLKAGDVLVARTGASTGENIYLSEVPNAVFASYLVRFQFTEAEMARFVGAFMRTSSYFDFVAGCIGGSAQPNASAQTLAGADLFVPPEQLLKRFADTVAPLDQRIAANNEQSRTLAALRDALLPKLLSGELRTVLTRV